MTVKSAEVVTAAVVQWSPSFMDAQGGTERACAAIEEAAAAGANLVVFPEAWLTGYPYFEGASQHPDYFALWRSFAEAAVAVPGPEVQRIAECAGAHGVEVILGLNERDRTDAIFNTMVFFGSDGRIRGRHRKLMPTITEKLIWALGDGSDLEAYDTAYGRVGGLICYEHQMALARYACCSLGVQVHASLWPGHAFLDPVIDATIRSLSFENACFVISAREVMSADHLVPGTPTLGQPELWAAHGGSAIVAPGGEYLAGPVFDAETIITAEIDLGARLETKWWVNGAGNYARPDVFQLLWDKRPRPPVVFAENTPGD
jgi:nitrilase